MWMSTSGRPLTYTLVPSACNFRQVPVVRYFGRERRNSHKKPPENIAAVKSQSRVSLLQGERFAPDQILHQIPRRLPWRGLTFGISLLENPHGHSRNPANDFRL